MSFGEVVFSVAIFAAGVVAGVLADWYKINKMQPRRARAERQLAAQEEGRRLAYRALADSLDPVWMTLRNSQYQLSQGELPSEPGNWRALVATGAREYLAEWERSKHWVMADADDKALLDEMVQLSVDVELLSLVAATSSDDSIEEARTLGMLLSSAQKIQDRLRWKAVRSERQQAG